MSDSTIKQSTPDTMAAAYQALNTAETDPGRLAVICDDGRVLTYGELAQQASWLAGAFRARGLTEGDAVAVLIENRPSFLVVAWACRLAALYYVCINTNLGPEEVAYIVNDSDAKALVASPGVAATSELDHAAMPRVEHWVIDDATTHDGDGWSTLPDFVASADGFVRDTDLEGDLLQYSSGTTGRPKGIRRALRQAPKSASEDSMTFLAALIGATGESIYLSPAPIYHTAPNMWTMTMLRMGATVVLMRKFDPLAAMALIEQHRITHAQFVPTMFARMLKLPEALREKHSVSSLTGVVHAGAPCPEGIKRAMIEWWGPVIHEYWSSSEGAGFAFISAEEWLAHPGSVGKSLLGPLHICDPLGNELPVGETGTIWAENVPDFTYLNTADKTAESTSKEGWRTAGDIGRLDEDGYLYLTDRASFLIITGGVNIYPQEAENLLIEHPAVYDAAVVGVPDDELGEIAVAVVQPLLTGAGGAELAAELREWCELRLARFKCPRRYEFADSLPRTETGKLLKRHVRDSLIDSMKGTNA